MRTTCSPTRESGGCTTCRATRACATRLAAAPTASTCAAGGYGMPPQDPFPFASFGSRRSGPPEPAVRPFFCTLRDLSEGCTRRFELKDTMVGRLRDAFRQGADGPLKELAIFVGAALWKAPGLIWGRWWMMKLPVFIGAVLFTWAKQLPPVPAIRVRGGRGGARAQR